MPGELAWSIGPPSVFDSVKKCLCALYVQKQGFISSGIVGMLTLSAFRSIRLRVLRQETLRPIRSASEKHRAEDKVSREWSFADVFSRIEFEPLRLRSR